VTASYDVRDGIAVVTMDNPPVNSLGLGNRRFIAGSVSRAQDDPAVRAIVLTGQGRAFCGGADIREFNTPEATAAPDLVDVIRLVEGCSKPVVAAIHGVVMGGGLELAMGCHYRVVQGGTQVALPEVRIGILPGATGTQRLPRLIGLEAALNMIVTGNTVMSEVLAAIPSQKLFDRIEPDGVVSAAIDLAHAKADVRPLPRSRDLKVEHRHAEAYLQFARNTVTANSRNYPAPLRCLDCVAQSVRLDFDAAVDYERAAVTELVWTPESAALRHAFFAERAASKIPDVPEGTSRRALQSVGVIGAGTMGDDISTNFLDAGVPVKILEMKQEALDRGIATIKKTYEAQVNKGKLKQDKYEQRMALLSTTLNYDDLKNADLIIEAVSEELGVKEKVFKELDRVAKAGAILASSTSTPNVDKIAAFTKRPQDVVGMHFFRPANVMKLLEVVRGKETAKDVLATVMATARKIQKTAVVSGVCDGFIGNRMIEQYSRQAGFLLDEGATPQQVDKAIEKFGFAMGPFRSGYVADMDHRKELGITPRNIYDEEIVQRLVYALVNEGAHILDDGIASKSGDIDMVCLTGCGFPLWRGGPMHYASQVGLYNVAESMKRFARNPHGDASFWQPAPLIRKLVAEGKAFT